MVLDLDLFRVDKGGDPDRVRQTLVNRYKDATAVDRVIDLDGRWRKCRHDLDRLNKAKNSISKTYGAKVKSLKGAASGDSGETSPSSETPAPAPALDLTALLEQVDNISTELTLADLKQLRLSTEEQTGKVTEEMADFESQRNEVLREIGNLLHPDVPISDDEDNNAVLRTSGDVQLGKGLTADEAFKSHVDLITLIGGLNSERGSVVAGRTRS